MIKNIFISLIVLPICSAFANEHTVEVYCLDKTTRKSYGVSGTHIQIASGGLIEVPADFSKGESPRFIDLKKGECVIQLVTIPDSFEG